MEDDQNGRRPKWKTTNMEDDQNGRRAKWKTTKMEMLVALKVSGRGNKGRPGSRIINNRPFKLPQTD